VRERIRELRDQEQRLRDGLISGALDTVGDDFTVIIEVKPVERVDLAEMRKHVDEATWRPYLVSKEIAYVTVRKRK
jgi:hypothetical protein